MAPPPPAGNDEPGSPIKPDRGGPRSPNRRGSRRAPKRRSPQAKGGHSPSSIRLVRIAGDDFELVHPRQVIEVDLDYQEGLEIWKAGDPEGARDALRYALGACHDNLWVHVALGQIALRDFRDPTLARGHFGYAVDLAERALPRGFTGRLPREHPAIVRSTRRLRDWRRAWRPWGEPEMPASCVRWAIGCLGEAETTISPDEGYLGPKGLRNKRRRLGGFFDFSRFSDLRGFADRYRTSVDTGHTSQPMVAAPRSRRNCAGGKEIRLRAARFRGSRGAAV
ncbi:MAG TPA: hypothetical protein VKA15_25005 [Isosphaeraceae bacterium]|nr:hypothetical protein [Isosphaeraceae bacterium]